jgi:DNA-binding sugar fermentation-stimulating protein
MKTLIKILALGVLTALLTFAATAKDHNRIKPDTEKDKGLFIFKADKKMIGAKVEIVQANGSVIAEQILTSRKLVIDFNDIRSGTYKIRIVKGEEMKEFSYSKE